MILIRAQTCSTELPNSVDEKTDNPINENNKIYVINNGVEALSLSLYAKY